MGAVAQGANLALPGSALPTGPNDVSREAEETGFNDAGIGWHLEEPANRNEPFVRSSWARSPDLEGDHVS